MPANRANVLHSVHRVLEQYAPLVNALNHVIGATRVRDGARIIGNSVRIEELPVPVVVLDFDAGQPGTTDAVHTWDVFIDAIGADVFEAANLLDLIEDAVSAYTRNQPDYPQPLNEIRVLGHQRIEPQPEAALIAVRVTARVRWA